MCGWKNEEEKERQRAREGAACMVAVQIVLLREVRGVRVGILCYVSVCWGGGSGVAQ